MQGDNYKDIENRGWAAMEELLDQNLPVKRNILLPLFWIFGSVVILTALIWLVYPLNEDKEVLDKIESFDEHIADLETKPIVPIEASNALQVDAEENFNKNSNAEILSVSTSKIKDIQIQSAKKPVHISNYPNEISLVKDLDFKHDKADLLIDNEMHNLAQIEELQAEDIGSDRQEFFKIAILQTQKIPQIEFFPPNFYLDYSKIQSAPFFNTNQHKIILELGYLGPLINTNHGVLVGLGYYFQNKAGFYTRGGIQYSYSSYRNSSIFDFEAERALNEPSGEITGSGTSLDNSNISTITDENGIRAEYYSSAIGGVKNLHQFTIPFILGYQFNNKSSFGLGLYYSRIIKIKQEFSPIQENQISLNLSYAGLSQNNLSKSIYNINNFGLSLHYDYSITKNISFNFALRSNFLPIIKTSEPGSGNDLFAATSLGFLYKL